MDEELVTVRVGAISPEYPAEWLMQALFVNVENRRSYVKMSKTETIPMCGYGLKMIVLIEQSVIAEAQAKEKASGGGRRHQ